MENNTTNNTSQAPKDVVQQEALSGNNAPGVTAAPPPPPSTVTLPVAEQPSDSKKKRNVAILLIAVFLLVLITLFTLVKLFSPMKDTQQKPVVNSTPMEGINTGGKKTIRIGTDNLYPPMEFMGEDGTLQGFDIDFGRELINEMGSDVEFKVIAWDNIFKALESGEIDMIIDSVTITQERQKTYLFSEPYFNAGQVIVTKDTSSSGSAITKPEQLEGKRVGVQPGTTSEQEALKYTDKSLVIPYDDYPLAVDALIAGMIDAIIIDLPGARGLVDSNSQLTMASDPFTNEYYGVVLKKGNNDMKAKVDKVILSFQERGVLDNIKQKWFE